MSKFKKKTTALLAIVLSASLTFPASLQASTVLVGASTQQGAEHESRAHWAQASIDKWIGHGVVQGYSDGSFRPNQKITRAELVTIINRLFAFYDKSDIKFSDISDSAWYAEALSIAKKAGYYEGFPGNLSKATEQVTRQDVASLIAKAFTLKNDSAYNKLPFADESKISDYARDAVTALSDVISGYPDGTFRPTENMTRAELVKVIDRLVAQIYNKTGAATNGSLEGNVIINQSGVALKDTTISGNLYLAPGIADGDASLDHVTVKGTTYVSGGGQQSIHITDSSLSKVIVQRAEGKIRVVVSGTSTFGETSVNTATDLVLEKGSALSSLLIGSGAAGSALDIRGAAGEITVQASDVSVNGQAVIKGGVYAFKDGKLEAVTPSAGGGSGNAGSGSGGSGGSAGSGGSGNSGTDTGTPGVTAVNLVDSKATAETKSLFAFLNETRGKAVLFGHQHDTTVSFAGKDDQGKVISDVKNSAGDYPAVFGWDTLSLDGHETPPGVEGDYEASRLGLSAAMKHAYELGGIVTLSTHPYNFATGGDFNDTSNTPGAEQSVVTRILPGGDKNAAFREYLDRIASFANQLKDDDGKLIPVLFRPFHEQNGSWFWWGAATTTKSEYVELYRYTVEYLRDVKNVRNFLYVYSPNGSFNGNESQYLTTYPGDEFVDILGMDQYDNKDNAGSEAFLNGLVKDLKMISLLADKKAKIATFSEYGYSAQGMKTTGNNEKEWFTKITDAIKSDPDAKRIAYMLTWANFGEGNNLFVPYKDVEGKGSHELLEDFINFYNDPYTSFVEELKGKNVYGRSVNSASEQPFMHIVTPTNIGTASESPTVIRAKVLHTAPTKVTYSIGQNGPEADMTLDNDGYYSAPWMPEAELNGKSTEIKVRAYLAGGSVLEQMISVFVKVREVAVKQFTFDTAESLEMIQSNGTYPDGIKMTLGHSKLDGDGKLELQLSEGLTAKDTWQELKLQLTDKALEGVNLATVKRLKLSALIPASLASEGAAIQAVAMYPENWDYKYGMDTKKTLAELEQVTVSGATYYKYEPVIELDNDAAALKATGLAISLVGSGLQAESAVSIYVDQIGLYNAYTAPILDTSLVDDFESYGGSSDALAAKYPKAGGDDVSISLSPDQKLSGDYGMQLEYAINTAGYTGIGKSLGTVDWSDSNALHMWVTTDNGNAYAKEGKPLKLVIQINMNGTAYEAYPVLESSKEYELTIPFSEFVVAPWSSGGPVSKESLSKVTNFNIYINAMDQGSHQGVLHFDDIRAVHDDSIPDLPDNSGGQGGTEPGVLYEFKSTSDMNGWEIESNTAKAQKPAFDEVEKALGVEFSLVNTGKKENGASNEEFELTVKPSSLNLTGLSSISADVKLSKGTAKARLFIKSGGGWYWVDSDIMDINSNGYTSLSIPLPEAFEVEVAEGEEKPDLKDIKVIGIKIEGISNDGGTAKLHLKNITLNAANE